jgi:hypothetical protein
MLSSCELKRGGVARRTYAKYVQEMRPGRLPPKKDPLRLAYNARDDTYP